jgi:ribosomal protein S18 acetylase RimI-like enzyme
VGIVTRTESRRRGVAATVSSELVARHFANGGDFVFLDAANEEAARVYERLGFARFGANLVYRNGGPGGYGSSFIANGLDPYPTPPISRAEKISRLVA